MSRKDKCTQNRKTTESNKSYKELFEDIFENKNDYKIPIPSVENKVSSNLNKISIHKYMQLIENISNSKDKKFWIEQKLKISNDDEDIPLLESDNSEDVLEKHDLNNENEDFIFFQSANISFPESVLTNILLTLWMEDAINNINF